MYSFQSFRNKAIHNLNLHVRRMPLEAMQKIHYKREKHHWMFQSRRHGGPMGVWIQSRYSTYLRANWHSWIGKIAYDGNAVEPNNKWKVINVELRKKVSRKQMCPHHHNPVLIRDVRSLNRDSGQESRTRIENKAPTRGHHYPTWGR